MGRELGVVLEERIPEFLVALGKTVAASGMDYASWNAKDPTAIDGVAAEYLAYAPAFQSIQQKTTSVPGNARRLLFWVMSGTCRRDNGGSRVGIWRW